MMNRRKFLWTGAIFVPASKSIAQAGLRAPSFVGGLNKSQSAPLTCQSFAESTHDNDYYTTSSDNAQKVRVQAEIEVCQIDLKLFWQAGTTGEVKVQCWSAANRTGTQYGSDSNSIVITSGSYFPAAWGTFTFATNPTPSTDFWICLVKVTAQDVGWRVSYNHTAGSSYYPYIDAAADEAYCAYAFGANRTTSDFCFKAYTMQ